MNFLDTYTLHQMSDNAYGLGPTCSNKSTAPLAIRLPSILLTDVTNVTYICPGPSAVRP